MKTRPKIVTLCGSTRFKAAFIEANYRETMAGRMVFSVGWFSHADGHVYSPTPEEKAALDELHLAKIDEADEILVLNVAADVCTRCGRPCPADNQFPHSGCCHAPVESRPYVGVSTRREIAYAEAAGKVVRYLNPPA